MRISPNLLIAKNHLAHRLKSRYFYYAAGGPITEGTVNIIMLSPLRELMGLCDPPFKIQGEKLVKVFIEEGGEEEPVLEGFIDAKPVQNRLWVVLIESKRYGFSVRQALPQTLAYMMANPNSERPVFGMITTGEDYIFVKLNQMGRQASDVQQVYSLQPSAQRTLQRDAGDEANCWLACAGINGALTSTCVHSGIGNLTLL